MRQPSWRTLRHGDSTPQASGRGEVKVEKHLDPRIVKTLFGIANDHLLPMNALTYKEKSHLNPSRALSDTV